MARNDITGDIISTGQAKGDKEKYANGWELLWGNRTPIKVVPDDLKEVPCPPVKIESGPLRGVTIFSSGQQDLLDEEPCVMGGGAYQNQEYWMRLVEPLKDQDPCPGCPQGIVCKTPNCGRLIKEAQDKSSY